MKLWKAVCLQRIPKRIWGRLETVSGFKTILCKLVYRFARQKLDLFIFFKDGVAKQSQSYWSAMKFVRAFDAYTGRALWTEDTFLILNNSYRGVKIIDLEPNIHRCASLRPKLASSGAGSFERNWFAFEGPHLLPVLRENVFVYKVK